MADVLVRIPELEEFRTTVDSSQRQFGEIRQNLNSHLQGLRSGEWETQGAQEFDMVFKKSEGDILRLEDTMQQFVAYLNQKIQELWDIDKHSVSL